MIYIDYVEVGKLDQYDKLLDIASVARKIRIQFISTLAVIYSTILINLIHIAAVILCNPNDIVCGSANLLTTVTLYLAEVAIVALLTINEKKCEMNIPKDMNKIVVSRFVITITVIICLLGSCANISLGWINIDTTRLVDISLFAPTIALTVILVAITNTTKVTFGRDYLRATSQIVPIMDEVIAIIISNKWWLSPDKSNASEPDIRRILQENLNY